MSNKAGLSMKIDADLKHEAELVMEQYGLNPTTAITMFYKQIARERAIPLSLSPGRMDIELSRAVAASQQERSNGFMGYPALQVADEMDAIIKEVEDGKR